MRGRPSTYDVYVLIDPRTGQVFYVGCTSRLPERFNQHLKCNQFVLESGIEPIVAVVHARKNKEWALAAEKKLIERLSPFVTNIVHNKRAA